jgi:hypothetical protein
MGKNLSLKDNRANQLNVNKGFKGENKQFAQMQGNRGKQIMQAKSTKNK